MKILAYINLDRQGGGSLTELLALTDASLLTNGKPQFLPDLTHRYTICTGMAIQIHNTGKKISPKFIHRYCDGLAAVTLLIDITALERCRAEAIPFTYALSFDFNVARSGIMPFRENQADTRQMEMQAGDTGTYFSTANAAPNWRERLSEMSQLFTFRTGDLLIPALSTPIEVCRDTHIHIETRYTDNSNIIYDYNIK